MPGHCRTGSSRPTVVLEGEAAQVGAGLSNPPPAGGFTMLLGLVEVVHQVLDAVLTLRDIVGIAAYHRDAPHRFQHRRS